MRLALGPGSANAFITATQRAHTRDAARARAPRDRATPRARAGGGARAAGATHPAPLARRRLSRRASYETIYSHNKIKTYTVQASSRSVTLRSDDEERDPLWGRLFFSRYPTGYPTRCRSVPPGSGCPSQAALGLARAQARAQARRGPAGRERMRGRAARARRGARGARLGGKGRALTGRGGDL